jgi:hypothetical protein
VPLSNTFLRDLRNKITQKSGLARALTEPRELVAQSDVVIENFRPGTLVKWGLGWEILRKINPKLVLLLISQLVAGFKGCCRRCI